MTTVKQEIVTMWKMPNLDFPEWLQSELDKRNWRPTDLAKRARLSDAAISRILRGSRNADTETLIAFADVFNISPITIFRAAGLLPPGGENINFADWEHLLQQLSASEQEEIYQILELKVERRKQAEQAARAKNFKPHKKAGS